METVKRIGGLGSLVGVLVGLAAVSTGRNATAAWYAPNVDCQQTDWKTVRAAPITMQPITVQPVPLSATRIAERSLETPVYQESVSSLLASQTDPNVINFTKNYYDSIGGADNYYYLVSSFNLATDPGSPTVDDWWVAIPIVDNNATVAYYPSYPTLSSVQFPFYEPNPAYSAFNLTAPPELITYARSASSDWPKSNGTPEGVFISGSYGSGGDLWQIFTFNLSASNYAEYANVMSSAAANAPEVSAQDGTCILIVDQNGIPLDYAAHLAEWDPSPGCTACAGALH